MSQLDFNLTTDGKRNVLVSGKPICIDPTAGFEANSKIAFLRRGRGNLQKHLIFREPTTYIQPNFRVARRIDNSP
jgi:hypothetical protein